MPSISFLRLPFLAQEVVLLYLDISEITGFALNSKRCQRVVQRIHHPYTGINIYWSGHDKHIRFMCPQRTQNITKTENWTIHWVRDALFPQLEKHLRIFRAPLPLIIPNFIFDTYCIGNPASDFNKILNYSREIFNLKVISVDMTPDDVEFRGFVSCIGECRDFQCYNRNPMRREDHQYILDNVKISGEFKSQWNFID